MSIFTNNLFHPDIVRFNGFKARMTHVLARRVVNGKLFGRQWSRIGRMSFSCLLAAVIWSKINSNDIFTRKFGFEVAILLNRCLMFALSLLHSLAKPSKSCTVIGRAVLKKHSMCDHFGIIASFSVDFNQINGSQ